MDQKMNNVYVVVSVKGGAELDVCEVYSDLQVALGRASALAHFAAVHHPEWLQGVKDKGLEDEYTRRWIFLDNYSNYVAVHNKKVHEPNHPQVADPLEQLKNFGTTNKRITNHLSLDELRAVVFQHDYLSPNFQYANEHCDQCSICKRIVEAERAENPLVEILYPHLVPKKPTDPLVDQPPVDPSTPKIVRALPPTPVAPPLPKDDPADRSLPAGWSYAGKPVTIADLIDNPSNVYHTWHLSEAQRWALAIARISKRPAFTVYIPGKGNCDQFAALNALKGKTSLGQEILLLECNWLNSFLTLQQEIDNDEESSSSEESDAG